MKNATYIKTILLWLTFIPIAILNGIFRENFLNQKFNTLLSHQISTIILSILFLIFFYIFFNKNIKKLSLKIKLKIGSLLVLLTLFFEFTFGYFIAHKTIQTLLYDYNIMQERIWLLFLIIIFTSPFILQGIKK